MKIRQGNTVSIVVRDRESLLHDEGRQSTYQYLNRKLREAMREPITVLKNLSEKAKDKTYEFQRLYRNLYNPEFYFLAYQNIYATPGSMTPGIDGKTLDGMSTSKIDRIISSLKEHSYQPQPARRVYINKKNSKKKRPLGIPSTDDKLVQGVVKMLLESIYEPIFQNSSHGFRPHKSCHTALQHIKVNFAGAKWFIEGDIKACFDSFDQHVLTGILRKRIKDENFISLMWKFLKAGYMEQWEYHTTYSGTPQGSGISPILANIYLNEMDEFIRQYKENYDVGESKKRKLNPEYTKAKSRHQYVKGKYAKQWEIMTVEERERAKTEVKELRNKMFDIPRYNGIDKTFKSMQYCRYCDDWIIGVIGSKDDAMAIKADIKRFLQSKLKLELSDEKTTITHTTDMARFLGYDITISRSTDTKPDKNGILHRSLNKKVKLYVPKEKWLNKLKEYEALKITRDENNKERWIPQHRGYLINMSDIEILNKYNAEIEGLYNYYRLANNATVISKFAYIMEYSMYRTFAAKYSTRIRKIINKYKLNGEFGVTYQTASGTKRRVFYRKGFKRQPFPDKDYSEILPQFQRYKKPNSLIARIRAGKCEYCGKETKEIQVHQVRKLKYLQGGTVWEELMKTKRRKTLVVCTECHDAIHKETS